VRSEATELHRTLSKLRTECDIVRAALLSRYVEGLDAVSVDFRDDIAHRRLVAKEATKRLK
jgi:hypothetical protein